MMLHPRLTTILRGLFLLIGLVQVLAGTGLHLRRRAWSEGMILLYLCGGALIAEALLPGPDFAWMTARRVWL